MKIAFVTIYFPPIAGGEGNNAYFLAKELAKKHDVHVFTLDRKQNRILKKEEILNRIKVHRFKPKFHFGYHFFHSPELIRNIMNEKFDIIHLHSFGVLEQDRIVLKKKESVLINTPAHPSFSFDYSWPKKIVVKLVKWFEKTIINPKYDKVIAISKGQNKWMTQWGVKEDNIRLVPCGINKEQLKKTNKEKAKKKFNLKKHTVIGYLGRLQEYKGISQIVEILPRLKKKFPNTKVLFVGEETDYKKKLLNLAKKLGVNKDIIFFGKVGEKEKTEILATLDLFILPSKIEGFGIVLLEAMAQGIPIISTKTDGGKFLIENEKNGFLYEFGDIKDLLEKSIRILIFLLFHLFCTLLNCLKVWENLVGGFCNVCESQKRYNSI